MKISSKIILIIIMMMINISCLHSQVYTYHKNYNLRMRGQYQPFNLQFSDATVEDSDSSTYYLTGTDTLYTNAFITVPYSSCFIHVTGSSNIDVDKVIVLQSLYEISSSISKWVKIGELELYTKTGNSTTSEINAQGYYAAWITSSSYPNLNLPYTRLGFVCGSGNSGSNVNTVNVKIISTSMYK